MKTSLRSFARLIGCALLFFGVGAVVAASSDATKPPLFAGTGAHTRAITGAKPETQRYFDQGVAFITGFNHDEGLRAMEYAVQLDPECAMAWWGVALACSPHINNVGVSSVRAERAKTALVLAKRFSAACTPAERALIDAMTTPIRDEDSASAVVPLIIRGPAELGDKIKQFKFERSFDASLVERADRVLERILQGLDVPKDVVTGLANVKYSNALQIDESLYKAHIEPLMLLISDALTVVYLRPYLLANGFSESDVERVCVWYDPSQVATRNDRAADADSGFDRMAISMDTWRRAHGFTEADAPNSTEVALRLLIEKGVITPELTESMLSAVAPDVMKATRMASQAANVAPIPPEVERLLKGPQDAAPTEEVPAESSPAEASPTPETTPTQEGTPS